MAAVLHASRVSSPKNHLFRLAQPLFWILDEMFPEMNSVARLDTLQTETRQRLADFKVACHAADLPGDCIEAVHYFFCSALDQAGSRVQGKNGVCRGVWLQRSLLKEFYGENGRGQLCQAWIKRLQEDLKSETHDALEVIEELIDRGLQDARGVSLRNILPIVPPHEPAIATQQTRIASGRSTQYLAGHLPWRRYWPVFALVTVTLFGLTFLLYRQHTDNQALKLQVNQLSENLTEQQESLNQRLTRLLAPDTGMRATNFDNKGERIHLLFSSDAGFSSGKSEITPQLARQLDQLVKALPAEASVTVIGHTDASSASRESEGALNLALSQARAMSVGRYLQERTVRPGRISVIGRGAADPIGDNRTEAGKALNRRIEIVIDQAQR